MRAVSVTEFARERGVSRARVYQWIDDGRVERLEDGRIDAEAAHAKLGATLDQAKGIRREGNVTSQSPAAAPAGSDRPPIQTSAPGGQEELGAPQDGARASSGEPRGDGGREDYWESKARREAAEAQLSEMRALQVAGSLVAAAGVRKELAALARTTRNAMLELPNRLAPVLDPANPSRAHKLLTDEISKALRELTARLEQEQRAAAAAGAAEPERAVQ